MRKFLTMAIAAAILLCSCTQAAAGLVSEAAPEPEKPEGTIIYGKIRSANGNEIVLVVGEPNTQSEADMQRSGAMTQGGKPQMMQGGMAQNGMPQGEMAQGEAPQKKITQGGTQQDEAVRENRQGSERTVREMPEGGTRTIMRGDAGGQAVSLSYTGEERTYVIPVTAKITTGSGENARTLRFTQLAYKNVVQVTLGSGGNITAIQVLS